MGLFNKQKCLYAVCRGRSTTISEIPDEAFAGGMLGCGFAVEPADHQFYSPADGRVESVAETGHAYTLQTDDGLDVLIHIGVDTVGLHGEGFEPLVKEGDRVRAGTLLARANIDFIKSRGLPAITAVLVTNPEKITDIDYQFGSTAGPKDAVMYYRIQKG